MARSAQSTLSPAVLRAIDIGGLLVSSLCAVHCALTPVLLVALPFLSWQAWEWPLRIGAILFGVGAVGLGAFFHRNTSVVWPLLLGVGLIGVASLLHSQIILEVVVSIAASAALIRAHWLNARACAKSGHDCPPARRMAGPLHVSHPPHRHH